MDKFNTELDKSIREIYTKWFISMHQDEVNKKHKNRKEKRVETKKLDKVRKQIINKKRNKISTRDLLLNK